MSEKLSDEKNEVLVLGGGLTGLSAGYVLSKSGIRVSVFESDSTVGGLSKTIIKDGFRFDLGGHRFFTKDRKTDNFIKVLMKDELLSVPRKSKIFMRNKYFDYPLKPLNAMLGLGILTTIKIIADYGVERLRRFMRRPDSISLEDWVISNFGKKMFDIYFREYSEKVWGIECRRISMDWVAQRIRGLSLSSAVKNAIFKFNGKDIPSLVDRFVYPRLGIGRISDRLAEEINKNGTVSTGTRVERVNHDDFKILDIEVSDSFQTERYAADEFISSIPITHLVKILNPAPPERILTAASSLKFRDLVVVAVMIDRERATDQTWIYIPEKKIPFGRIHEPTNWSAQMAPAGKTLIVAEFFSFAGDSIWNEQDEKLIDITVKGLENLGFINEQEVIDGIVVRVPKAYPLFEIGYRDICNELYDYLDNFANLHIAGRSGMFRYYNMDHAIESGIRSARAVIEKGFFPFKDIPLEMMLVGNEE